jgi:bromodomain-containing protein 8
VAATDSAAAALQTEGSTALTMSKLGLSDVEDGVPLGSLTEDFRDEWELEKEDPEVDEEELERKRKGWKAGILNVSCEVLGARTGKARATGRSCVSSELGPYWLALLQVWRQIAGHKDANLFRHPVKEEHAPGYYEVGISALAAAPARVCRVSSHPPHAPSTTFLNASRSRACFFFLAQVVKRPMDLQTIKIKIDSGEIETTRDFEHAVMLMVNNAVMYNDKEHFVYVVAEPLTAVSVHHLSPLFPGLFPSQPLFPFPVSNGFSDTLPRLRCGVEQGT